MPTTDVAQFERTFADLAYASIKNRAPMLMEHLVGWQLVDVNEDETRAVGIFGFKVGEQWLYAPVFFMNGELKGNELLYLKGQDIFVPMQENWINYIVNRRPYVLGQSEPMTLEQLGYQPPDFTQYSESPETKRAQVEPLLNGISSDWAKDAVAHVFASDPNDGRYKKSAARLHLPAFLREAGHAAYETFLKAATADEKFMRALGRFYAPSDFHPLTPRERDVFADKSAALTDQQHITGTAPEVVVIMPGANYADGALKDLTDAEKQQLLRGEIVVQDHRQGTSNVYPADIHKNIFSPTESGCYDVLMRDGQFKKLLVIHNPRTISANSRGNVLVVDPDAGDYMLIHATSVYAKRRYHDDSWREVYEGLPGLDSIQMRGAYILLGPDGGGTVPFRVKELAEDKQGRTYIRVSPRNDSQGGHALIGNTYKNFADPYDYGTCPSVGRWGDDTVVLGDTKSKKLRSAGQTLFVPDGFKAIKVNDEYQTHRQIDPGTMADLEMEISKLSSVYPIKVYDDNHEVHISSGSAHFPPMNKNSALRTLITQWGMSEDDARDLLKQASGRRTARAKVHIKKALAPAPPNFVSRDAIAPYYGVPNEGNKAFDSLIGVEAQHPYASDQQVPIPQDPVPLQPYNATADYSNPMQEAAQAAASGQKEVFDMSSIERLSKLVDISETIDRYQSDLVNGMDRVGRILFIFYWHYDKFADRYGKDDLPELEDSLKSTFKQLGDLILFMKQKSIEPDVNIGLPLMAGAAEEI